MPPDSENKPLDKIDLALSAAIFILSSVYFSTYYDAGINWMDEGLLAARAMRILSGEVSYRDFYDVYTPGFQYLIALCFYLFGANFLIIRIVCLIFRALFCSSLYLFSRKAMPRPYSIIPSIAFMLAPGPWHKICLPLSILCGMWIVVFYLEKTTLKRAFLLGAGTATIFAFRQDVGLFYGAVGALFIFLRAPEKRYRSILFCGLGFVSVTLVWISYFLSEGAGASPATHIFFSGAKGLATNPLPYPRPFDRLPDVGGLDSVLAVMGRLDFYMPIAIVLCFLYLTARDRKSIADNNRRDFRAVVAISVVVAFNQIRSRPDFSHLWQIYPLISIMAAWIVFTVGVKHKKSAIAAAVVFLIVVAGGAFSSNELFHGTARVLQRRTERYKNPQIKVLLTPEEAQIVGGVELEIEKYAKAGAPVFLAPDISLFYFITGTRNPTPWENVRPGFLWNDEMQLQTAKSIESAGTGLIVIREPDILPATEKRFGEVYPLLYRFILQKYFYANRIGDFHFYVLKNRELPPNK